MSRCVVAIVSPAACVSWVCGDFGPADKRQADVMFQPPATSHDKRIALIAKRKETSGRKDN